MGPVTVGHVPRELSRFISYFIQEGGSVTGTVANPKPKISPIPEGGLEVPILMHFTHENKVIFIENENLSQETSGKNEENFWFRDISRRELFWKPPEGSPTCAEEDEEKEEKE